MKKGFRLRRKKKKKVTIVTLEDAYSCQKWKNLFHPGVTRSSELRTNEIICCSRGEFSLCFWIIVVFLYCLLIWEHAKIIWRRGGGEHAKIIWGRGGGKTYMKLGGGGGEAYLKLKRYERVVFHC